MLLSICQEDTLPTILPTKKPLLNPYLSSLNFNNSSFLHSIFIELPSQHLVSAAGVQMGGSEAGAAADDGGIGGEEDDEDDHNYED